MNTHTVLYVKPTCDDGRVPSLQSWLPRQRVWLCGGVVGVRDSYLQVWGSTPALLLDYHTV